MPLNDWGRHATRLGARKALARGEEPAEIIERFCVSFRETWGWIDQAVIEETTRIVLGTELH